MFTDQNLETVAGVHTYTHTSNIKRVVKHIFSNPIIRRLDVSIC